jgi:hypothetical protein
VYLLFDVYEDMSAWKYWCISRNSRRTASASSRVRAPAGSLPVIAMADATTWRKTVSASWRPVR